MQPSTASYAGVSLVLLATVVAGSCDFSPTAPFAGFDEQGSRVSGRFQSSGGQSNELNAAPSTAYEGLAVYVEQKPSISASVQSNGAFTLIGLPPGTIAVVFERDRNIIGRVLVPDVVSNQEIRMVVTLTGSGQVELVSIDRDNAGLGECARSPGFWCQNQNGKNPNMTEDEFVEFATSALERLRNAGATNAQDIRYIRDAVCDSGNQLLRHLTAMLLNIAAGLVDEGTALAGEDYATVGELVDQALTAVTEDSLSRAERNAIKDALDRANNNVNTDTPCQPAEDPDDAPDEPEDPHDEVDVPAECVPFLSDNGKKVTICHKSKNTLSISVNALPAHLEHGDKCGPCQ